MNVNCYLPDDLAELAKAYNLRLSSLLRGAVIVEIRRLQTETEEGRERLYSHFALVFDRDSVE